MSKTVFLSILAAEGLDALENEITLVVILTFVVYIGIPLIKILFNKKDD